MLSEASHLVTWLPVAPAGIKTCQTQNLCFVDYTKWIHASDSNMDSCFLPMHSLFSCPTAWSWTLLWHWWFACSVAYPVSWDIDNQARAWKFCCPFSPYSVSPRQGTCWETNVCAGRIDLHLKFVIWHSSATRFCNLQGGMKTFHDEHFGCSPLCLIFFICTDHVWNQSYWSQEYHRSPLLFNLSSPNTESLNQGTAVFSARLMYCRTSGWSAKPQGTGADVASRRYQVIACTILCLKSGSPTRLPLPTDQSKQYNENSRSQTDWSFSVVLYETWERSTQSASEYDNYNLTCKLITILSDDLFNCCCRGKLKVILFVPRHSSKFSTR